MLSAAEALEAAGLTREMKPAFVEKVVALARPERFARGQLVVQEDGRDRDVFVLVEGKVSIVLLAPGSVARTSSIVTLRPIQVFGEFSMVDGAPRSASVRADTDVAAYRLGSQELWRLCREDSEFGFRLMQNVAAILAKRIRDTTLQVRNSAAW